jgi:hypothetical protein
MKKGSIKEAQSSLQKTITWTKQSGEAYKNGLRLGKMHIFTPEN